MNPIQTLQTLFEDCNDIKKFDQFVQKFTDPSQVEIGSLEGRGVTLSIRGLTGTVTLNQLSKKFENLEEFYFYNSDEDRACFESANRNLNSLRERVSKMQSATSAAEPQDLDETTKKEIDSALKKGITHNYTLSYFEEDSKLSAEERREKVYLEAYKDFFDLVNNLLRSSKFSLVDIYTYAYARAKELYKKIYHLVPDRIYPLGSEDHIPALNRHLDTHFKTLLKGNQEFAADRFSLESDPGLVKLRRLSDMLQSFSQIEDPQLKQIFIRALLENLIDDYKQKKESDSSLSNLFKSTPIPEAIERVVKYADKHSTVEDDPNRWDTFLKERIGSKET